MVSYDFGVILAVILAVTLGGDFGLEKLRSLSWSRWNLTVKFLRPDRRVAEVSWIWPWSRWDLIVKSRELDREVGGLDCGVGGLVTWGLGGTLLHLAEES